MRFPSSVTVANAEIDSVESARRFLAEHPEALEQKQWQYVQQILEDVALRGGIRAAYNAVLLAAKQDQVVK
jgi:hypothetical protein